MSKDLKPEDLNDPASPKPEVSELASTVLSVLSRGEPERGGSIRAEIVEYLVRAVLSTGPFQPEAQVARLHDNRIAADQIVDVYIPEAARQLGDMWVNDAISFAQTTIASARLQGLLTLLAPPWEAGLDFARETLLVLMVLPSHDSHTLGPHVATAQLRRLGASVRLLFGPDTDTVLTVLQEEPYDLVLFSTSRTDALATIADMVKSLRTELCVVPPIALGGLVLDLTDRVREKTGVDLVTSDVKVACKLCVRKHQKHRSVAR